VAVFWVVSPCNLVGIYRRFRGAYCLPHRGDEGPDDGGSKQGWSDRRVETVAQCVASIFVCYCWYCVISVNTWRRAKWRGTQHARVRWEMRTRLWVGSLMVVDHSEDISVDGRILLRILGICTIWRTQNLQRCSSRHADCLTLSPQTCIRTTVNNKENPLALSLIFLCTYLSS
jgi:hypothetical protein